jgi:hypothetical protein
MSCTAIEKTLSANDTGETGGHQAGLCVPRDADVLAFFPKLDAGIKNPRAPIDVVDETGNEWTFSFIYYNNRFFGGTRNEYRLTCMTPYFKEFNLKAGDTILMRRESPHNLRISFRRANQTSGVLRLSSSWKVIETGF